MGEILAGAGERAPEAEALAALAELESLTPGAGFTASCDEPVREIIAERHRLYRASKDALADAVLNSGIPAISVEAIWGFHLPLAQHIARLRSRPDICLIVAFVGGPGAGKTTLTRLIGTILTHGFGFRTASMSSDDFYLPKSERLKRGLQWRGLPESHDVAALKEALDSLKNARAIPRLPRFDLGLDDRAGFDAIPGPLDFCLFEGWMSAALIDRFGRDAATFADYTIFLKMDVESLRSARLEKESKIRSQSNLRLGLSPSAMERFWEEIIRPGLDEFVFPFERSADLTISLDAAHHPIGFAFR